MNKLGCLHVRVVSFCVRTAYRQVIKMFCQAFLILISFQCAFSFQDTLAVQLIIPQDTFALASSQIAFDLEIPHDRNRIFEKDMPLIWSKYDCYMKTPIYWKTEFHTKLLADKYRDHKVWCRLIHSFPPPPPPQPPSSIPSRLTQLK